MKQYHDLMQRILDEGVLKKNRTGIDTLGIHGAMMQFDMRDGFPAVTTKKLMFHQVVAEMIGFFRGYDSAADFRKLGCTIWDANANENSAWLQNPYRRGDDDLGRVYGVQWRNWMVRDKEGQITLIDQFKDVIDKIKMRQDNRRLIVSAWNPGDMDKMALPPCHLLFQFGIEGDRLNLCMYQRSCDMFLGVPFNIAGYALMLHLVAACSGLLPGTFTHFLWDVHLYINHVDQAKEQLSRSPFALPELDLDGDHPYPWDYDPGEIALANYFCHPYIKAPMAV